MNPPSSITDQGSIFRDGRDGDDEIDLLRLVQPVWRRRWSVLSLVAVVLMVTELVVLNMTPIYQGSTTLLIEQKAARLNSLEELYGIQGSGTEYLQTQFELLKSRDLAERVVRELNLTDHPEYDPAQQPKGLVDLSGVLSALNPRNWMPTLPQDLEGDEPEADPRFERAVGQFMEATEIEPRMRTQLVRINVESADPRLAAKAADALARAYVESQLEAKLSMSQTATSWMNEQLLELKADLATAERNLQAFREQENLVDVQGVTTVAAGELQGVGQRLTDARRRRSEVESQFRQVQALAGKSWDSFLTAPAVMNDPLIQQFRALEATARGKVEDLSKRYGPKHPKMISARTELAAARETLQLQVEQVVASIEKDHQLAEATERSLQSSFDQNKTAIQDITRKEFRLNELQREVDTYRQLYEGFLARLQETSANEDFDAVNARVVEGASVPKDPIRPAAARILAIVGLLALLGSVGGVILLESLSNTFKSIEDVENHLDLPLLGALPLMKVQKDEDEFLAFRSKRQKGFAESIRTLRTSLMLSSMDAPHRSVLITSSTPGEGKSTVAVNLAYALSQMNSVLLLECDLRRPSQRKHFDLPVGTPGVANYIAQTAPLDECIQSIEPNFDLMTAGIVPPNPQELLASPRFATLLEQLKSRYEIVVIDTPPTLAVSDATLLSQMADAVIYLIKSDATAIPLAQRGVGQLLQQSAPVVGVVLNQVDIQKAQKYGYSYGGYYDYYGYTGDQKS